jgi:hypothetical protein
VLLGKPEMATKEALKPLRHRGAVEAVRTWQMSKDEKIVRRALHPPSVQY